MGIRLLVCLVPAVLLSAADKKPLPGSRGENQDIIIQATLYADKERVKELLGSDLDGHYIVADVKIEPKYGKEVAIYRDEFLLRTDKDGEKTTPFEPSQIAGQGVLVVRRTPGGGGVMGEAGGPVWGGAPGTMGGPMRLPGSGGTIGSGGSADAGGADARVDTGAKEKENPLLKVLREKVLKDAKTDQPVSGLLYFPLGKQKVKDLEMTYGGRENRITMRFK
jgi:hypothetical protein